MRIYLKEAELIYDFERVWPNKHCFRPYERDGKFNVKVDICAPDHAFFKHLHYACKFWCHLKFCRINFILNLVLVIAAILLIIPIVIYAYFEEIRQTLNGKLCIALLITQIYVIIVLPLEEMKGFRIYPFKILFSFYFLGAFSSAFVVNLMCFDIYLTLRHFRVPHYQWTYFKKSICFLLIVFGVSILLIYLSSSFKIGLNDIAELMSIGVLITFCATNLMNIFALIAAFYYLVALTRSTMLSENTRFDVERER
jgi:hypothetical protein